MHDRAVWFNPISTNTTFWHLQICNFFQAGPSVQLLRSPNAEGFGTEKSYRNAVIAVQTPCSRSPNLSKIRQPSVELGQIKELSFLMTATVV